MLNILLITLILVYIIDISGAIEQLVEPTLAKIIKAKRVRLKKPFSCSRCMSFWIGLLYILITWQISIPMIAYVCLMSFLTPFFNNVLSLIMELLMRLTNII